MTRHEMIRILVDLEREAAGQSLWITKRAINIVIKVIGWEAAGNTTMAAACLPPPDQDEYKKRRL